MRRFYCPGIIGITIFMGREVECPVRLVAPKNADFPVEGNYGGDIITGEVGRASDGQNIGRYP